MKFLTATPKSTSAIAFRSMAPLLACVAGAYLLYLAGERGVIDRYPAKIMLDVGIGIILAVSLNIVNGYTGQFSLGHAGFMAIGGYTAAAFTYYGSHLIFGSSAIHEGLFSSGSMVFLTSLLAGGLVAAVIGFLVGLPSLRLRGDYLAIVTLGFGEIVRVLLQITRDVIPTNEEIKQASLLDMATSLGGSLGFVARPFPRYTNLFWVYVFVFLTILVAYRLKVSSYGRAFLSIREDEIAAEAMGINTAKYKVRAFVISAFLAGIAGGLFAHMLGTTLNPRELGFQKSIEVVIMVVLGGMGSISGAIIAAASLTVLPEALREFADYRMIIYALMLIIVMILRPQGLFGVYEISDVKNWIVAKFKRKTPTEASP